jgi:hypothetical protein
MKMVEKFPFGRGIPIYLAEQPLIMVIVIRIGRTLHGFERTGGETFQRPLDLPAVDARMMPLVVIVQEVVVGSRTERRIRVELANFPCFFQYAPPGAGLFGHLTQNPESSFSRLVIEDVRVLGIANGGDAQFGGFNLEYPFHRPFERKLERERSVFIQTQRRHGFDVKRIGYVRGVEHHIANVIGGLTLVGEFSAAAVADKRPGLHIDREPILVLSRDAPLAIHPNQPGSGEIPQPQENLAAGLDQTRRAKLGEVVEREVGAARPPMPSFSSRAPHCGASPNQFVEIIERVSICQHRSETGVVPLSGGRFSTGEFQRKSQLIVTICWQNTE